jgi:hypothetical protein
LTLDGLAGLAAYQHQPERSARLLGAAAALREAINAPLVHVDDMRDYSRFVSATQAQLDEAPFAMAWAEGQAMTLEQAIAYALEDETISSWGYSL